MNHAWTGKLVPNKSKPRPSWNEERETEQRTKKTWRERIRMAVSGTKTERGAEENRPPPTRVNAGKNGDSANVFRGSPRSLFSDN